MEHNNATEMSKSKRFEIFKASEFTAGKAAESFASKAGLRGAKSRLLY
jgi:hypothetical protein